MEGGRYFRTGAYEKEKFYRKDLVLSMKHTLSIKCEENVMTN